MQNIYQDLCGDNIWGKKQPENYFGQNFKKIKCEFPFFGLNHFHQESARHMVDFQKSVLQKKIHDRVC